MSAAGSRLWLAVVDDGDLVSVEPYLLEVPEGLESGERLVAFLDDCRRVVAKLSPGRVLVLNPETTGQTTFLKSRGRATAEAFMSLAAAQAEVPCTYLTRQRLRSVLGLPKAGKLSDLAGTLVHKPMRPHWKNERDLASLAALAAHRMETT